MILGEHCTGGTTKLYRKACTSIHPSLNCAALGHTWVRLMGPQRHDQWIRRLPDGSATAWPMNQKITRWVRNGMTNESEDYPAHCFLSIKDLAEWQLTKVDGTWAMEMLRSSLLWGSALRMPSWANAKPAARLKQCKTTAIHCYVLFNSSLTPYTSLSEPVIATCCCDTLSTPAELHAVAKSITIQARYCLSGTSSWGDEAMASNELGHRKRSKKVLPTADMRLHKQIMCDMMTC